LSVLALTAILAFRTTPVRWDYNNLFAYEFPSAASWQRHLDKNRHQIDDGSEDPKFLNACYRGGWNRCLSAFHHGNREWDYYWISENEPNRMSGNMPDTDRVAGQLGWQHCTDRLIVALKSETPQSIKSRIYKLSTEWLTFVLALVFGILLVGLNYFFGRNQSPSAG
jgi:hypothetical protein